MTIVNGTNPGCGTEGFSCVQGMWLSDDPSLRLLANACLGWDPVTGLGTPNYPKMLKLFMSLP